MRTNFNVIRDTAEVRAILRNGCLAAALQLQLSVELSDSIIDPHHCATLQLQAIEYFGLEEFSGEP